ncbi:MAG: hypothetical protein ISS47_08605 [Candidatus Omnitrophica bacterium]|nr:hypothetical protein [Candidatus Omnitrophota bacterium]
MSYDLKIAFSLHNFKIIVSTNDRAIFTLIKRHLDFYRLNRPLKPSFKIHFLLNKVKYSQIPVTKGGTFQQFPIFQDKFLKQGRVFLNVGLRAIKTIINPRRDFIESFIATPGDINKDLLFDLIFFQPLKVILRFHRLYLLHASCVSKDGKGVLFSGESESGKTTLALALVRDGFNYLADDDCLLSQKGRLSKVLSFPTKPKIKDRLIRYFPEIKPKFLSSINPKQKKIVYLEKIYPRSYQENTIPRLLIFLNFIKGSKLKVKAISKKKAFYKLLEEDFVVFKKRYKNISKYHFEALFNLSRQIKAFELSYKDKDIIKIPKIINELLKS